MALDLRWQDLLTEVLPSGERVHFTGGLFSMLPSLLELEKLETSGHLRNSPQSLAAYFAGTSPTITSNQAGEPR